MRARRGVESKQYWYYTALREHRAGNVAASLERAGSGLTRGALG